VNFDADPWDYLQASQAVDLEHEVVQSLASLLREGDDIAFAHAAFDYVRDDITHCLDAGDPRVTWRASDVLTAKTGFCYAKSHAYAALLRAAGIQAGLCYQDVDGTLHGLAAALIDDRWVRLDPRGNNAEVNVQFSADEDCLAYPDRPVHPTIYAEPHPAVLKALQAHTNAQEMAEQGELPTTTALDDWVG
jgi:transglutaminase-like putative cysteine protease